MFNPLLPAALLLAAALFVGGFSATRYTSARVPTRAAIVVLGIAAASPGLLFVLYYTHLLDGTAWLYELRAIPYTELAASGLGFIAGIFQALLHPASLRGMLAVPAVLATLILVPYVKPILAPVDTDRLNTRCPDEVCLQSTPSTCGPATASTVLKLFGQSASEKELAIECFTSVGGTESWYLARALRNRGLSTEFITQRETGSDLPCPAIAGVTLSGGSGHFIAILRATQEDVVIGDPLKGKMSILRDDLERHYHFTGFFLVVRDRSSR